MPFKEPYLSQFRELIRGGAAGADIHDANRSVGFATTATTASEAFLQREETRVESHTRNMCRYLDGIGRVESVVDVGCGTGALSVAVALALQPSRVVGVDANSISIEAARTRALGYGVEAEFRAVQPGQEMAFMPDASADLVLCTSVLEFITHGEDRARLIIGMLRVARPGGHVFITTPSRYRLRELHSRRWLGNFLKKDGFPWASSVSYLREQLADCEMVDLTARRLRDKLPVQVPAVLTPLLGSLMPWQFFLARKKPAA